MKKPLHKKSKSRKQKSKREKSKESIVLEQIPKGRLWLYKLIAIIVIPILFFLLLEFSLRTIGVGYPTSAIIQQKVDGVEYIHDNPKFGYRYFSKKLTREFTPFRIPSEKQPHTCRIFVIGGSAAQGTPETAYSFSRMLNVMLRHKYPSVRFEVINMAMPAINSHVVLDIADDCLDYQPDVLVCYMGNNEVVGPYGPGTVFSSFASNLQLVRFINSLKSWRIVQVLTMTLEKIGLNKEPDSHWKGMEMFLEKQLRFDDPALNQVYVHFESNLQKLSEMSEKKGTKLIMCTVGINLKDNPPFSSLHNRDISEEDMNKWKSLYKQGVAFESEGQIDEAIQMYLAATKIDSVFADLQFRLGRCYWQQGKFAKAEARYKLALEFDTNRFRSDKRINEIIRDVADNNSPNVYLVNAWDKFKAKSPYGVPGKELFLEHVHLNFRGNYLLAQSVFDHINMVLPERTSQHIDNNLVITDSLIANDLVFTELSNYQINESVLNDFIKRPPFTNQLYHAETVDEMQKTLDTFRNNINREMFERIERDYQKAIQGNPTDWMLHWKYAGLLASSDLMNDKEAAKHFRYVKKILPHYPSAYVMLGLVTGRLGMLDESVTLNEQALRMDPTIAEAYFNIGLVAQINKQSEQALEYYHKTLYYNPEHQRAYNNIGVIYYNHGDYANSIKILKEGLAVLPENVELHYKLAYMYNLSGKWNEAAQTLKRALKIDPGNEKIQAALNSLLQMKRP